MKTLRAIAACLLTSTALCLPLCLPARVAYAQMDSREAIDLQNQIAELRQELQMMQQAQQSGAQPPPQAYAAPPTPYGSQAPAAQGGSDTAADLLVRVSALEEQVRTLQGKVDDLTNALQHQHDELSKQIGDLSFKMGQGGTAPAPDLAVSPPKVYPPPEYPTQPAPPAHRTAELALREGNTALARRDYAAAAAAAREVLDSGHGPRLTDAQFLLARAEGGQGQFKESAADYYKAYSRAPKSPTAQVALLGVANALLALNDKTDACQALAKLGAEFPQAPGSVKQSANATRRRAGCGR